MAAGQFSPPSPRKLLNCSVPDMAEMAHHNKLLILVQSIKLVTSVICFIPLCIQNAKFVKAGRLGYSLKQ